MIDAKHFGEAFNEMLQAFMPRINYVKPAGASVVSLGCGFLLEGQGIVDYFGPETQVLGIDANESRIILASHGHKDRPNFNFARGLAQEHLAGISEKFDAAIAAHPDIYTYPNWVEAFQTARRALKPDGILIATAYLASEVPSVASAIDAAGYKIVLSSENNIASLPHPRRAIGDSFRYVILARK